MHAVVRETVVVPDNSKPWQIALQEPHSRLVRYQVQRGVVSLAVPTAIVSFYIGCRLLHAKAMHCTDQPRELQMFGGFTPVSKVPFDHERPPATIKATVKLVHDKNPKGYAKGVSNSVER